MILQIIDSNMLNPLISLIIIILLIIMMIYFYSKKPIPLIIIIIYLFSLIIGFTSMSTIEIPFTPYFQIFFILFQTIFLVLTLLKFKENYYEKG